MLRTTDYGLRTIPLSAILKPMPQTPHIEKHFTAPQIVRDVVIGMADGLTVPFALAAGLSAVATNHTVVVAGLAEIAAGSIAMGLGGFLAGKGDVEHYAVERKREQQEIIEKTNVEIAETMEILQSYGLSAQQAHSVVMELQKRPEDWVDFMMRFELGLESPQPGRALKSGMTIGGSYVVGGMIPLFPYMVLDNMHRSLVVSVILTLLALLIFGYIKGTFTGTRPLRSALYTTLVGGLAAATAFGVAKVLSGG